MKKKYDFNKFINQFNINIKQRVYGKIFNGFYRASSYKHHLKELLDCFAGELFYGLPSEKDCNKEILLTNIYLELEARKKILEETNKRRFVKTLRVINYKYEKSKGVRHIILYIHRIHWRRIVYMYYQQVKSLNRAIEVTMQAALRYHIDLQETEPERERSELIRWSGEKLEFIQIVYAFLRADKIEKKSSCNEKALICELAHVLGAGISQNTFTSLSHSIHTNNYDYVPAIFKKLEEGYKRYTIEAEEEHRKRTG